MITHWQMYWITRLEGVSLDFIIIAIVIIMVTLFVAFIAAIESKFRKQRGWLSLVVIAGVIILFLGLLTPTTKEMAAIIVIPKIVNNPEVQKLPTNLLNLSNEWIEEKVKKLAQEGVQK